MSLRSPRRTLAPIDPAEFGRAETKRRGGKKPLLTEAQRIEIREAYALRRRLTTKALAARFNVSQEVISRVGSGQAYRNKHPRDEA